MGLLYTWKKEKVIQDLKLAFAKLNHTQCRGVRCQIPSGRSQGLGSAHSESSSRSRRPCCSPRQQPPKPSAAAGGELLDWARADVRSLCLTSRPTVAHLHGNAFISQGCVCGGVGSLSSIHSPRAVCRPSVAEKGCGTAQCS